MNSTKTRRIGPAMRAAADYVRFHPGCSSYAVSIACGPHGSSAYGWNTVQRAAAAGLIMDRGTATRHAWYVAE